MHHYFLFAVIAFILFLITLNQMATTLQRGTTKRSDAPKFFVATFYSYSYLYNLLRKILQTPKLFLIVVQFQEESRTVNYGTRHIKKLPRAKRPPTTDRAERLTLIRKSRSTRPTTVVFPPFRRPTSLQNIVSANFCSD